jgi:hypothetical protein
MIPEILHIQMPQWIMKTTPSDYKSVRDTIDQSNKEIEKLKTFLLNRKTNDELNEEEQSIDISDVNHHLNISNNKNDTVKINNC